MRLGRVVRMPAVKSRVPKYRAQHTWVESVPPYRLHDHATECAKRGIDRAWMLKEGKKAGWVLCASRKEAERYGWLLEQQEKGRIVDLRRQVPYACHVHHVTIGTYIADFVYWTVLPSFETVEDAKGMRTDLYRWKKKHVEAQYGITIREV